MAPDREDPLVTVSTPRVLLASDRCDACPAAATTIIVLPSGGELLMCSHHATKHRDVLSQQGATLSQPANHDR